MSTNSSIQWTDATWNPVAGCSIVSAGCAQCYAMKMAARLEAMGQEKYRGLTRKVGERHEGTEGRRHEGKERKGIPVWTGKLATDEKALLEPLGWRKPRRVFVNSMSDLFHEDLPFEFVDRVFAVMALCPQHQFQVLTKRPERMDRYLCAGEAGVKDDPRIVTTRRKIVLAMHQFNAPPAPQAWRDASADLHYGKRGSWPLPNLWLGTSCENQAAADERIPHLLRCPAAVRFVSAEPLLGPIDFPQAIKYHFADCACIDCCDDRVAGREPHYIDWIIVGGESGPGARPCDLGWIQDIVSWSRQAEVACFVKQLGARPISNCKSQIANCKLKDKKGGDPAEWPESLRVREFPQQEAVSC